MPIIAIRQATLADIPAVAEVHAAAFPKFFLTLLGPALLRTYYRTVLEFDTGRLFVADDARRAVGFVAGFADPGRFYASLARKPWRFAGPLAVGLLCRPWLVARILTRAGHVVARGRRSRNPQATSGRFELSSLAVHPAAQNRGIGRRLVTALVESARNSDATVVSLTTDALDNAAVNAFYARSGFRLIGHQAAHVDRPMNEYEYSLRSAG